MNRAQMSDRERLLCTVYVMARRKKKTIRFEDIAVMAFKKYPESFQLRGYSEYPDTVQVDKRIYELKKNGLITINNRIVSLTSKGETFAAELIKSGSHSAQSKKVPKAMTRDIINEIERIRKTEAYQLFVQGKKEDILDTDFFAYLGTTVRSERTSFKARVKTVDDAIKKLKKYPEYQDIIGLHKYIFGKFLSLMNED
jgi:hypothetical protein